MESQKKNFFISYNKADKNWAEWIAWALEEAGHTIVIQAWDFRAGSNFVLEMQKAAAGTEKTIAVLSQHYLDAEFTQPEWAAEFARDPKGDHRSLVPMRVAECTLTGLLSQIVYVDLVGLPKSEARQTLLDSFKPSGRPDRPPSFPGSNAGVSTVERVAPNPVEFPGDAAQGTVLSKNEFWYVPHERNDFFTGRGDILQQLRTKLTQENTTALAQTQAISGLGGIGKTQTALEYAYRHREDYRAVFWLEADTESELNTGFIEIARVLGLALKDEKE